MLRREFCLTTLGAAAFATALPLELRPEAAPQVAKQSPPELTRILAEFVARTTLSDVPRDVIELAKKSILDGFGLALAGSVSDAAQIIRKYVAQLGTSDGHCLIAGTGMRAPAQFAALCNGVSIHINDYDDSLLVKDDVVHATVPTLPAAFAAAELTHASGRDLLLAYILGVEVECKIAEAISPHHYREGFHATGTIGPFGGAAATAKILKLDAHQIAMAFGIVAAQAAGVRVNFGTMTKPYQAGHAAESGTVAATLASLGWTAAPDVLEAPRGFLTAMGGAFEPSPILSKLGNPWSFQSPGILIKRFPCGTIQQPVMDAILSLRTQHNIVPSQVESVHISGSQLDVDTLFHHHPKTALEAKFSMEFCVSILLLEGKAGLSQFSDAEVARGDVQALISRVSFSPRAGVSSTAAAPIEIRLSGGRVISAMTGPAKGDPANPMTWEEVSEKFDGCVEVAAWQSAKAKAIQRAVHDLEAEPNLENLSASLSK